MKMLGKLNRTISTGSENFFGEYKTGYRQMADGAIAGTSVAVGMLTASSMHSHMAKHIGSVPSVIISSAIGGAVGGIIHHACKCTADSVAEAVYNVKSQSIDDDDAYGDCGDDSSCEDDENEDTVIPSSEIPKEEDEPEETAESEENTESGEDANENKEEK